MSYFESRILVQANLLSSNEGGFSWCRSWRDFIWNSRTLHKFLVNYGFITHFAESLCVLSLHISRKAKSGFWKFSCFPFSFQVAQLAWKRASKKWFSFEAGWGWWDLRFICSSTTLMKNGSQLELIEGTLYSVSTPCGLSCFFDGRDLQFIQVSFVDRSPWFVAIRWFSATSDV